MNVWPWIVVLVVAVGFVDAPLLRAGLPLGDDTEIHLYRLVDLDHLIRQGILYSRWQPDLVYGYGSPLFSYYAPLSAYLAEAGHLLGLSLRGGLKLVFAALPLVAGGATFAFLRRRLTDGPALLGAIAYLASFYFLYNVYVRGSVSDALAMALFPVVVLGLDRLIERPGPGRAALLALAWGALLLSHDVSGPAFLPVLVVNGWWWSWSRRSSWGWPAASLGLGIGLALFFYGPATLGVADTRVPEFLATPGMRYDQHFVAATELFVPVAVAYRGAMLTNLPIGLGLVQTLLGLAALLAVGRFKARERGEVVLVALTLLVGAFLALPLSDQIWAHIPFLQIIHYPWRLLGIATFAEALLIGYAAQGLVVRRGTAPELLGLGLAAMALLILAVPYLYPLPGDILPANPSLAEVTAFQQRSGALGSTSNAEFLPRGLAEFPPGPPFPGADQGASLRQKLDPTVLPADVTVQVLADGQLQTRLAVTSPSPFLAHFFVFRFPGWGATLDGQPASLGDPGPFQTLTVPIPRGQHTLTLVFGETRRQMLFDLLSLLSAGGVVGLAVAEWRGSPSRIRGPPETWDRSRSGPGAARVFLAVAFLAVALKWGLFDRVDTPLVRSFDGEHPPGMEIPFARRFGPSLELLGYTLAPSAGRPAESVTFILWWRTTAPLPANYSSFVHVVGAEGQIVSQEDNVHVADFPTTRWRVGAYARDVHVIQLPATLAPGTYRVDVGIYDRATGRQLPIDGATGTASGDTLALAPLRVLAR